MYASLDARSNWARCRDWLRLPDLTYAAESRAGCLGCRLYLVAPSAWFLSNPSCHCSPDSTLRQIRATAALPRQNYYFAMENRNAANSMSRCEWSWGWPRDWSHYSVPCTAGL